jgi:hypothetical protein
VTTERLTILAAAAALQQFTAPELTAYTGANPNTVRQVLHREQDKRGLFERVSTSGRDGQAQRPVLWRIRNVSGVLDELAAEEAKIAQLRSTSSTEVIPADLRHPDHVDALLTSAEDAVARSFEVSAPEEQKSLARVAINLLQAAEPGPGTDMSEPSPIKWWEQDSALGEREKSRARRVAAFACLADRRAQRSSVDAEQLESAVKATIEGRDTVRERLGR